MRPLRAAYGGECACSGGDAFVCLRCPIQIGLSLSALGSVGQGFITPARQGSLSVRMRWEHLFWVSYPE
jgi:hypothetical protein